jgi:hypothetical protein
MATEQNTAPVDIPTEWPGAFGVFKHAKRVVWVNVWTVLGLSIVNMVVGGISRVGSEPEHIHFTPIQLVSFLITTWVSLALVITFLAGSRGQEIDGFEAFKQALRFFINAFLAEILCTLLVGISLVALIIPALFVIPRLTLVQYFVVDQKLDALAAIKASWNDTKGHSLKVWGVIGVTVLCAILVFVLVGVYLLFIYQAAMAILYLYIKRAKGTDMQAVLAE